VTQQVPPEITAGCSASVWDSKWWRGTVPISPGNNGIGTVEHRCFATCCDIVVDFSETNVALPIVFPSGLVLGIYAFVGSIKTYRAIFQISPSQGIIANEGKIGTCIQDGNRFLIQADPVAANGWGVEVQSGVVQIISMFINSIAHGVELPAP
jgi:hypothetical protein